MKKLLLSALIASAITISAQSSIALMHDKTLVPIAANSILLYTTAVSQKLTVSLDIKNTSGATHTYDVKRYDIILNKSTIDTTVASAYFCFAGQCYGAPTHVSQDPLVLGPGKSASEAGKQYFTLDADMDEATTLGYSVVKYTFYDTYNVNDSAQVTIRYNNHLSGGVGIRNVSKQTSKLEVFPNPATDVANFTLNSSTNHIAKMMIFSSIGDVVYEKEVAVTEGRNNLRVNVQNLAAGVYFVQLKEGDATSTRKLVIE